MCTHKYIFANAVQRSLFSSFQSFHEAIYFSRAQSTFSALTYFCFVYTENCLYSEYKQMAIETERTRERERYHRCHCCFCCSCYILRNAHICLSTSKVVWSRSVFFIFRCCCCCSASDFISVRLVWSVVVVGVFVQFSIVDRTHCLCLAIRLVWAYIFLLCTVQRTHCVCVYVHVKN